jgi:hypothetical protein
MVNKNLKKKKHNNNNVLKGEEKLLSKAYV